MNDLSKVAPAFVDMAHQIAWASVATVGPDQVPRSRVLHPIWEWDRESQDLVGWIATARTPLKTAHLSNSPWVSVNYWWPEQDTCTAECMATWHTDAPTRERTWDLFLNGPEPVGYDPSLIPGWDSPASENFMVMRLDPWRLRVFPGAVLFGGEGEVLDWSRPRAELQ